MNLADHLAEHLSSVHRDGAWSEIAVRDVFRAMSPEEAAARPIPDAHSGWELLLHIDAWHRAVSERLDGGGVGLSEAEDWPTPPDATASNWVKALEDLDKGLDSLMDAVRRRSSDDLFDPLPVNPHLAIDTILGIAEHDMYHAGQARYLLKILRQH